jgi:CheY-like chemotaxis protein
MDPAAKILVVDDHADCASTLALLLRRDGYVVRTEGSYRSALEAATQERFDLLLSDIELRDGDGCDLLKEIQAMYRVPGIAVSAYGMAADVKRCLDAGFQSHIIKPFVYGRLCAAIIEALGDSSTQMGSRTGD